MSVGVPAKLLQEAEGHTITIETTMGEQYKGKLMEAEDNLNVQMGDCDVTHRNGQKDARGSVYIRGSEIRFFWLPERLQNVPMLINFVIQSRGTGRTVGGRSATLRPHGASGRGRGGRPGRSWSRGNPRRF